MTARRIAAALLTAALTIGIGATGTTSASALADTTWPSMSRHLP
ncbi:hypothetical protein [Nocardioides sp. P5_C9_2]